MPIALRRELLLDGLELCLELMCAHSVSTAGCARVITSHSSKPFELEAAASAVQVGYTLNAQRIYMFRGHPGLVAMSSGSNPLQNVYFINGRGNLRQKTSAMYPLAGSVLELHAAGTLAGSTRQLHRFHSSPQIRY